MKRILFIIIGIIMSFSAMAEKDYNTSIGARAAPAGGITVKHFISSSSAIEGILSTRWRGFNLTGLYEKHQNAFNTEDLNFFYGAGAHVGFWEGYDDHPWFDDRNDHTVIGIDGIIGLEYTFDEIPFCVSLDWKPAFNITSYSGFWGDEIGFSLRFTF